MPVLQKLVSRQDAGSTDGTFQFPSPHGQLGNESMQVVYQELSELSFHPLTGNWVMKAWSSIGISYLCIKFPSPQGELGNESLTYQYTNCYVESPVPAGSSRFMIPADKFDKPAPSTGGFFEIYDTSRQTR